MRDLLQEVGWTNLGCVAPPTSIPNLFSWNSLENKELCAENLNSPRWCDIDVCHVETAVCRRWTTIRASYFTTCSAISWMSYKREQLGKYPSLQRLEFEEATVGVAAGQFIFRWEVSSGRVLKVFISVTLRVQRRAHWLVLSNTVFIKEGLFSVLHADWTGSSFHSSSVRLRVQLRV